MAATWMVKLKGKLKDSMTVFLMAFATAQGRWEMKRVHMTVLQMALMRMKTKDKKMGPQ